MRRAAHILMAIGLLGSLSPACAGDSIPQEGRLTIRPGDKVLMLGDSITVVATWYWWEHLRLAADNFYAARGLTALTWVDSGISGNTTADLLAGVQARVIDHTPDVVIIHIGINDHFIGLTLQEGIDNYNDLLDAITAALPNVRILMLSPAFDTKRPTPDAEIDSRRTAFAAIARARGYGYVDLRAYYSAMSSAAQTALSSDGGLHPSDPVGRAWWSNNALFQINLSTE